MRGGLIGDEVERLASPRELGNDVGGIAEQADGEGPSFPRGRAHPRESVVERARHLVEVARLEAALDARRVDLDAEDRGTRHRGRERLRASHATEAGGQDRAAGQVGRTEVLLACGGERLVRPLEDPLRPDVDPAACGHLPEHRQALRLETAELAP